MRASRTAAAFLAGLLIATAVWGGLMVEHSGRDADALADAREQGAAEVVKPVLDKPASKESETPSIVPIYTQTDERWGGLPYAGSDLATSGCGLTCAAMAWSYLSNDAWTPVQMLNAVGNSCVQDGQNYMPGFCAWMQGQDPSVSYTTQYEDGDRALTDLQGGQIVFGSMTGRLEEGGREYGGHIVLLVSYDGEKVTIHDPCSMYEVILTKQQFETVNWGYFISLGRSE